MGFTLTSHSSAAEPLVHIPGWQTGFLKFFTRHCSDIIRNSMQEATGLTNKKGRNASGLGKLTGDLPLCIVHVLGSLVGARHKRQRHGYATLSPKGVTEGIQGNGERK